MNSFARILQEIYQTGIVNVLQQQQLGQILWQLSKHDETIFLTFHRLEQDIVDGKITLATL
ncbi:MAG: hypothetical protein WBB82_08725 [Limnothrix sp.]